MNEWLGERVPGEQTNKQKLESTLGLFAYNPVIIRIGKHVHGWGTLKLQVDDQHLVLLANELRKDLEKAIPAFTNISIKTDRKFNLVSFRAKIVKIR